MLRVRAVNRTVTRLEANSQGASMRDYTERARLSRQMQQERWLIGLLIAVAVAAELARLA